MVCGVSRSALFLAGSDQLFLDRDGVIVEEVNYLHRVKDMRLTANAATVIRAANTNGMPVIVVTNQSGIGRGKYGWSDFESVQAAMLSALTAENAFIDAVFACPFHSGGQAPWNIADHPDRKPGAGMLFRAAAMFSLDLTTSWIVGDRAGDIGAARTRVWLVAFMSCPDMATMLVSVLRHWRCLVTHFRYLSVMRLGQR